jgi:hypothetical protein
MSKKITNMDLASKIADVVSNPPPQSTPVHIKHYKNEQEAIIRQSCIKSAVHLMEGKVNGRTNILDAANTTLAIAEMFEAWVKR